MTNITQLRTFFIALITTLIISGCSFIPIQLTLADVGVTLKNKKDLVVEEVTELNSALDDGINFVSEYFQKLTGGGMDAPLKQGGIVGFKKGGVVRGLDAGVHKNVRLI